jgi:hypothetical protein
VPNKADNPPSVAAAVELLPAPVVAPLLDARVTEVSAPVGAEAADDAIDVPVPMAAGDSPDVADVGVARP